jgi:hypothetical protein
MKKSILLSVLMMTGYVAQAQTVQLQNHPVEGQACTMEIQTKTTISQSYMGQEMTMNTDASLQVHFTVAAVGETTFDLTAYFVNASMSAGAMGRMETFSVEGTNDVSLALKELMGKPFQLSMDKRSGKVIKVEGEEAVFAEIEEGLAALSKGKRKSAMDVIKTGFGGESVKKCAESSFMQYPENALRAGQAWMQRDTVVEANIGGKILGDTQYKLAGFDAEKAEITLMGMVQTDPNNKPISQNGAEVTIQIGGSVSGKTTVDVATGWVLESNSTTSLSGSADANMQGTEINVPMKVTIEGLVKRIQ